LARQLGGIPLTFKGDDVAGTIAAFVKEYGITHIILGRTQRPWYRRWFGRSVLDRLLRSVRGVDVVVVDCA
jgi:two-component system, OmpR family, sensor histidine kinase KdpD